MEKGLHSDWSISNAQLTGLYKLTFDPFKLIYNTILMYFLKSQNIFQWQSLYEKQNYFSFNDNEIDPMPSMLFGTAGKK